MNENDVIQTGQASIIESVIDSQSAPIADSNDFSDLEQRLQSILDDPIEEPVVESDAPINAPSEPPPNETQSKYSKEELTRFQEMFQDVMGVAPDAFKQQYQQQQKRAQKEQLQNDLETLQTEWSVPPQEVAQRLNLVAERLSQYPPQMQESLNNLEGIRLVWSSIVNDATRQVPPRFEKKTTRLPSVSKSQPVFTRAEIAQMDNATYQRNIKAIEAAYLRGLIQ